MSWIDDINKKLEEQREAFKESIESGEALRRKRSYASSQVSQETRSKAGKIASNTGKKNLEKVRTKEHQAKAGKAAGIANKKSGHTKVWSKAGADAASNKFKQDRVNKVKLICAQMQPNVWYTKTELRKIDCITKIVGIVDHEDAREYITKEFGAKKSHASKYMLKQN